MPSAIPKPVPAQAVPPQAVPTQPVPIRSVPVQPFPGGSFRPDAPAPGSWALVTVHGDLDIATGPALELALSEAAPADQPGRHLVLDLGDVTFLDCSGLRPLLRARSRLADRFWLANVPAQARRLLDLAGLDGVFAVLDDLPAVTAIPRCRTVDASARQAGIS